MNKINYKKLFELTVTYENNRTKDLPHVKSELSKIALTKAELFSIYEKACNRMEEIQDAHDMLVYERVLATNGDKEIKTAQVTFDDALLEMVIKTTSEDDPNAISSTAFCLKNFAYQSYKLQLKYTLIMLEYMLEDEDLFDKITLQ